MAYTITIDKLGGTGGTDALYYDGGTFYLDAACTHETDTVVLPTKVGYTANGAWSESDGGVKYINGAGGIRSTLRALSITGDFTIYVQWTAKFYRITVDKQGGAGGTDEFYYKREGGGLYSDLAFTTPITRIIRPTRDCYTFNRCWSEPGGEGVQYTGGSGALLPALAEQELTEDITIYTDWTRFSYRITVDKQGGVGGTDEFFFKINGGDFYADPSCVTPISSVAAPTKDNNTFTGMLSSLPSGTQYVESDGTFTTVFASMALDYDITVYVKWVTNYVTILIDKQGGAGGTSAIYSRRGVGGMYADTACTESIAEVIPCGRSGYTYKGAWSGQSGSGTKYIANSGNILPSLSGLVLADDLRIYVSWVANTYTLTFDYNGGTGLVTEKQVTFASPIGELPTGVRYGGQFDGWAIDGHVITATSEWSYAGNNTARASWEMYFGGVVDYFGLASASLIPESSNSGEEKPHVCAYNASSEGAVTQTGGTWRYPTVVYRVVGDMTLHMYLGDAFASKSSGVSGYMITTVSVETKIGEPPRVTVSGVANEGANAIKRYDVRIPLSARHRPQNLLNAIHTTNNGGQLQELTLTVTCDPVVVAENNMPCASDVCHGRIEVDATVNAYENESEPQAGTGFTQLGARLSRVGVGYKSWNVKVRKELQ